MSSEQMRKAARKQKKLEKEKQNALGKLDKNTSIVLPPVDSISIYLQRSPTTIQGTFVGVARNDCAGLGYAISTCNTLQQIQLSLNSCDNSTELLEYVSEALKYNTSVKFLSLPNLGTTTTYEPEYLKKLFPCIRDILEYNRIATLCASFRGTTIPTLETYSIFIDGLKKNTSLTSLTVPIFNYPVEVVSPLTEAIINHPNIVDLTIGSGHWISSDGWKHIAKIVLDNRVHTLSLETTINVRGGFLGPVFEALQHNTSLTFLSFAQKDRERGPRRIAQVTDKECDLLSESLRVNQTLTKLDLTGLQLGSASMSKLFEALQHHTSLTDLNFWEKNNLDAEIAPALSSFIQVNESLTELDLSFSNITAEACQLIGPALKKNRSITSLNMFMNPIGSEGCKYLAEGLKFNKALIRVDLRDCKILDDACVHLAEAIKTNPCLMHLDITGYEIKEDGYKALIEGMRQNNSLTDLTVSKDKSVPSNLHDEIVNIQNRNKIYQREVVVNAIIALIQIARSDAFDVFPLEIWLRIFKHFVCGGVPGFNHIAETILMNSDVRDLSSLCKMKIVRINGKSHLVPSNDK